MKMLFGRNIRPCSYLAVVRSYLSQQYQCLHFFRNIIKSTNLQQLYCKRLKTDSLSSQKFTFATCPRFSFDRSRHQSRKFLSLLQLQRHDIVVCFGVGGALASGIALCFLDNKSKNNNVKIFISWGLAFSYNMPF